MKVTLPRVELLDLHANLTKNIKSFKGAKLAYAVAKNIRLLETEIKSIQDASKPSEEFVKYDEERVALCGKFAKKDSKDEPVIEDGRFVMSSPERFEEEFTKLREENSEILEERDVQMKEVQALIDDDVEVELHMVSADALTDDMDAGLAAMILSFLE
jgi:hypothetical protein